jgi:hypothetical protein
MPDDECRAGRKGDAEMTENKEGSTRKTDVQCAKIPATTLLWPSSPIGNLIRIKTSMWFLVEKQGDDRLELFGTLHNHLFPDQAKSQNALWWVRPWIGRNPTHPHHSNPQSSNHCLSNIRPFPPKYLRRLIQLRPLHSQFAGVPKKPFPNTLLWSLHFPYL